MDRAERSSDVGSNPTSSLKRRESEPSQLALLYCLVLFNVSNHVHVGPMWHLPWVFVQYIMHVHEYAYVYAHAHIHDEAA